MLSIVYDKNNCDVTDYVRNVINVNVDTLSVNMQVPMVLVERRFASVLFDISISDRPLNFVLDFRGKQFEMDIHFMDAMMRSPATFFATRSDLVKFASNGEYELDLSNRYSKIRSTDTSASENDGVSYENYVLHRTKNSQITV